MSGSELARHIEADSPPETVLINISATNPNPDRAVAIADAVRASFIKFVQTELETDGVSGGSLVNLTTTHTAEVAEKPISPNLRNNLIMGLLLGFLLGFGIALLRSVLDNRLHSTEDIEQISDTPVIGEIFNDPNAAKSPVLFGGEWQNPRAEAFRVLRTNLQFLNVDSASRIFVLTSANPDEGKTTTAINLAIALAQNNARVALLECDLRRPKICEYLGMESGVGLTDVLIGSAELPDVIQKWGRQGLHVLPAGQIPPNPSELLGSDEMEKTLAQLREEFDYVIIDAPPVLAVTDAAVVAKHATGVLLVAAAGSTSRPSLREALRLLDTAGSNVLGLVLTMLPLKGTRTYSYTSSQPIPPPTLEFAEDSKTSALSRKSRRGAHHVV
nr:polysaccharide biosynthesis tyrosine autokinase [Corynebacterium occultum]